MGEKRDDLYQIDTGDFLKVKQTLDEAAIEAIGEQLEENHFLGNIKLLLMFIACAFACVAQFYPTPFPESRPILMVCCVAYFVLSGALQFIISYIEQDTIMITHPSEGCPALRIKTNFPRFQEVYNLSIQDDTKEAISKFEQEHELKVGDFFDKEGNFWDEGYAEKIDECIQQFRKAFKAKKRE
mmetsp:Transcript_13070/g.19293  ORF Transcript_13070/g.19293 Transcript_13070/m.19293 type:complete len:184 (-) Transcript_13070:154-705(-)|eukprot:CAMPEP_0113939300 /NCGR_PEP_ID=MMETSP1339-20121228/5642_1 /TAXON_ID=94617 /ORGANISM="Fibrocapsa japonica" /LENGTH=183 /DNA_ID=CAMNT_0000942769 /DNA_START=141 /DNA_END=692 /DNA_ORIENTATION=- /assembly_acc=CAM_ASM_000762